MSITIESPTAEAAFAALQQLPEDELARLQQMFAKPKIDYGENYQSHWTEEDLEDAARATALLMEKWFGPEAGNTN